MTTYTFLGKLGYRITIHEDWISIIIRFMKKMDLRERDIVVYDFSAIEYLDNRNILY